MIARTARVHFRQHRLDQFHDAEEVHFHHRSCGIERTILDQSEISRSGIVHQAIDLPELRTGCRDCSCHFGRLGNIEAQGKRALREGSGERFKQLQPARRRRHIVAALEQLFGHRAAKAA